MKWLLLLPILIIANGCGYLSKENNKNIGLRVKTTCEGDCYCTTELDGRGVESTDETSIIIDEDVDIRTKAIGDKK